MNKLSLNYAETGTPVPFGLSEGVPSAGEYVFNDTVPVANWHHGAMGRKHLLAGDLRMQALRYSSQQWVSTDDHWGGFHKLGLVTALPSDVDKSFVYIAMQRARYVGDYALAFSMSGSGPSAKNRLVPYAERQQLWARGHLACESPVTVAKYLATRVIDEGVHSLGNIEPLLDKYRLDPLTHELKLLQLAASLVAYTSDFSRVYTQARKKGHIPSCLTNDPAGYLMNLIMPINNQSPRGRQITNSTRGILHRAVLESVAA